ncbi:uncharacterized protein LOC132704210 [Cylas formicarius]|uniref:uncharacterized protein LOC132704210 n=1 Tax=Cylas formicarius TaxID=197179 RepID=UPI002958BBDA|nr:uncharacterized protein LOC132704210 [Cylas formicarius]
MTGFCTMIVCLLATLSFTKSKENNFTDLSDVSLPTESSSINQKFHVSDASDDENRGKRTNYGEAISTSADRAIKSTPKTDSAKIALEKFESSKLPGANIHDDGRFFKENGMDSSIGKRFKMETHENKFNKLKWILTKSSSWNNSVVTELPIDFQVPSTELENNVNENPVLPKSTNGSSNVASLQKGKATNDGSTTHGNIFERVKSARSSVNGKSKFLKPDVSAEVTNLTLTSPSNDIIFRTSEVSDNAMYNQKLSSELRSTITTPKEKFQTIRDGLAASVHSGTTPHNSSTPFGPRPVKMTPSSSTPGANVDTNSGYATGSSGDLQTSPGSYKTSVSAAITSFNSGKMLHHNESANKEIPWPVKKEAIVEGDLIIGGLMMVHEREDSITCGPVMPQGGIQALEAMLRCCQT